MLENKFQAVLEGADHDTPSRIQYCPFNIYIPKNATVLLIRKTRLFLYGRLTIPGDINSFTEVNLPADSVRGIPLSDESTPHNPSWIDWVFEMPRSVNTNDGRFYLNKVFFDPQWHYYFPLVKPILRDCNDFYSSKISEDDLRATKRMAF